MNKKIFLLCALLLGTYSTSLVFASDSAHRGFNERLEKDLIATQQEITQSHKAAISEIETRYADPEHTETRAAATEALKKEYENKMDEARKKFEKLKSDGPDDADLLM
jgi:hypothetical protein